MPADAQCKLYCTKICFYGSESSTSGLGLNQWDCLTTQPQSVPSEEFNSEIKSPFNPINMKCFPKYGSVMISELLTILSCFQGALVLNPMD